VIGKKIFNKLNEPVSRYTIKHKDEGSIQMAIKHSSSTIYLGYTFILNLILTKWFKSNSTLQNQLVK